MSTLSKVQAGERMKISARAYNEFLDMARERKDRDHNRGGEGPHDRIDRVVVKVANYASIDLNRGDAVQLYTQPWIAPGSDAWYTGYPLLRARIQDLTHMGRIGILLEPCRWSPTGIARCLVAGVARVQVDMVNRQHRYA